VPDSGRSTSSRPPWPHPGASPPSRPRWPPWRRRSRRPRSGGKSIGDWSFLPNFLLTFLIVTVGWGSLQAYLQHRSDQQRALDQQRATILQTYIDNMRDLLLNHNLAKSAPGDEVRQVARVQTLSTLRSLDASRNIIVLQFLQEAHLISAVINLSHADLSDDDLSGADLSGVDLTGCTLTGAHLEDYLKVPN